MSPHPRPPSRQSRPGDQSRRSHQSHPRGVGLAPAPATTHPERRAVPIHAILPDELVLNILCFLEINDLLPLSRTNRHLRRLARDPLLHRGRARRWKQRVSELLPRRPRLATLQPPIASIYLTRTHSAARRLHWSLLSIRLNKSLTRRPTLATLVSANILPRECCRRDRASGELVRAGLAGALVERKRRVEREAIKDALRVWLERKARDIRARHRKDGSVGIMIWRFTRTLPVAPAVARAAPRSPDRPPSERVLTLRRVWENRGTSGNG